MAAPLDLTNMPRGDSPTFDNEIAEVSGSIIELPSPDTRRWVVRRKAVVVHAVRNGSITLQEACRRYRLSVEEFLAWQRAIERHGIPGLRATRLQIYRETDAAHPPK